MQNEKFFCFVFQASDDGAARVLTRAARVLR